MRFWIFTFSALITVQSSAWAIFQPGFERPVYTAQVEVEAASGTLARTEQLAITKVTIDDSSETLFHVNLDHKKVGEFRVVGENDLGCGSKQMIAAEIRRGANSPDGLQRRLVITDHTARQCRDLVRPLEVNLSVGELGRGVLGSVSGSGVPTPLVSIL